MQSTFFDLTWHWNALGNPLRATPFIPSPRAPTQNGSSVGVALLPLQTCSRNLMLDVANAVASWADHPRTDEGWNYVDDQMHDLDDADMDLKGKKLAAGMIIEEPGGHIWIVRAPNGFVGHTGTFPKGHADDGMFLPVSAINSSIPRAMSSARWQPPAITACAVSVAHRPPVTGKRRV